MPFAVAAYRQLSPSAKSGTPAWSSLDIYRIYLEYLTVEKFTCNTDRVQLRFTSFGTQRNKPTMKLVSILALCLASSALAQTTQTPRSHRLFSGSSTAQRYSSGKSRLAEPTAAMVQRVYDVKGRLTQVVEPGRDGNPAATTQLIYNDAGKLIEIDQHGVGAVATRVRTFTYDQNGLLQSATSPEAGSTTYTHDAAGNIATKTDARGVTITYHWDKYHRLLGRTYSNGKDAARFISSPGKSESYLDAAAGALAHRVSSFNAQGQLTSVIASAGLGTEKHTGSAHLAYDSAGRLVQIVYPDGRVLTQSWTSGFVSKLKDRETIYLASALYLPTGQMLNANLGNGVTITRQYDAGNRLSALTITVSGQTILNKQYTYSATGSIQSIADLADPNESIEYQYDQLNRVSHAVSPNSEMDQHLHYDAFGNKLLQSADSDGSAESMTQKNRFRASDGFRYDEAGNLTSDGVLKFGYNEDGLLSTVDGGAIRYSYDAEGNLIRKVMGTATTDYLWVDGELLAERHPDGTWTDYIYLNGRRLAAATRPLPAADGTVARSNVVYFTHDSHGTVRVALSAQGDVLARAMFTPFGEQIHSAATIQNGFDPASISFTGEVHDPDTGLDNYKYRHYNAALGRWMSPDPSSLHYSQLDNPQTYNLYSYVTNDPLLYVDVDGLFEEDGNDCCSDGVDTGNTAEQGLLDGGGGVNAGDGGNGDCPPDTCTNVTVDPPPPVETDPPVVVDPPVDDCPPETCTTVTVPPDPPVAPDPPVDNCDFDTCVLVPNDSLCSQAGGAPDPSFYAGKGDNVRLLGMVSMSAALALNTDYLAQFRSGAPLDAQPLGGSRAYGNYVYGAYSASAGLLTLSQTLAGANLYATTSKAQYPGQQMDQQYPAIPADNVINISLGYNAVRSGTLCHK